MLLLRYRYGITNKQSHRKIPFSICVSSIFGSAELKVILSV